MSLFPIIQPQIQTKTQLPLCRDVQWDADSNAPVWRGGAPYVVTGVEAVRSWAIRALQVPRGRYPVYTRDYGNECERLIGSDYTDDLKKAEAIRYVRECLTVNPYVDDVQDIIVSFTDGVLAIVCTLGTVYGEVQISV